MIRRRCPECGGKGYAAPGGCPSCGRDRRTFSWRFGVICGLAGQAAVIAWALVGGHTNYSGALLVYYFLQFLKTQTKSF